MEKETENWAKRLMSKGAGSRPAGAQLKHCQPGIGLEQSR